MIVQQILFDGGDTNSNEGIAIGVRDEDNMVTMSVGLGKQGGVLEYPLDPLVLQVLLDALNTADHIRAERS